MKDGLFLGFASVFISSGIKDTARIVRMLEWVTISSPADLPGPGINLGLLHLYRFFLLPELIREAHVTHGNHRANARQVFHLMLHT